MEKRGLQPSPLEFIRLTHLDKEYAERFAYCKKTGDFYEFEITPDELDEGEEHLTVSARGVVHYVNTEYTFRSISDWERETRIFS